jgi:hypothetical protein
MCGPPKAGFRLMPLTDAFEIIRAEVRNCRIFAVFHTPNPLKLRGRRPKTITIPDSCGATIVPLSIQFMAVR